MTPEAEVATFPTRPQTQATPEPVAQPRGRRFIVLLIVLAVLLFGLGLISEQIATLRFDGRK